MAQPTKFQPRMLLHLLRSLFPRWSFFDRVSYDVDFEIKTRSNETWRRISFTLAREPFGFVFNPRVNLALAQQSLVEQFVQDLREHGDQIEAQTSYKMILSAVHLQVPSAEEFQFKISARHAGRTLAMYASSWLQP